MIILPYTDLEIELPEGPIGVSVSGGADSAILLYFLMKYHKHKIYITTLADRSKFIRNPKKSLDIVAKVVELTENENYEHKIKYVNQQNDKNIFKDLITMHENGTIINFYQGITANPPDEITFNKEYFSSLTTEDKIRSPNFIRTIDVDGGFMVRPWTNIDKKAIAQMYIDEGLLDILFPLTGSCEWQEHMPFTEGVNPYTEYCGKCWWCEERIWGFGRIV